MGTFYVHGSSLGAQALSLGAWVISGCSGALWVPGCSLGAWALCGFLGYLCVHGRSLWMPGSFLWLPGLCLGSWAISVCMSAPCGYVGAPSGRLGAFWVPGHFHCSNEELLLFKSVRIEIYIIILQFLGSWDTSVCMGALCGYLGLSGYLGTLSLQQ